MHTHVGRSLPYLQITPYICRYLLYLQISFVSADSVVYRQIICKCRYICISVLQIICIGRYAKKLYRSYSNIKRSVSYLLHHSRRLGSCYKITVPPPVLFTPLPPGGQPVREGPFLARRCGVESQELRPAKVHPGELGKGGQTEQQRRDPVPGRPVRRTHQPGKCSTVQSLISICVSGSQFAATVLEKGTMAGEH